MNKEDFEVGYCERSNITRAFYNEWFATFPCACDYEGCKGWAAVSRDDGMIKDHMELYAPRDSVYEE